VADQDRRRFPGLAQMLSGVDEIGDIGREGRIGEIAFAGAEPREVEGTHCDAARETAIRFAASTSLPQMKQCAEGSSSGSSNVAASWWPPSPTN